LSPTVGYAGRMARPRKDGRLRMDSDIRIPLTSEMKAVIVAATRDEPEGMAAWARAVLLDAARRKTAKAEKKPTRRAGGSAGAES
jgi:hypothetical protein